MQHKHARWLLMLLATVYLDAAAFPPGLTRHYGATPIDTGGLAIEAPANAENAALVPIRVKRTASLPADVRIDEIAVYAENDLSKPLARFRATAHYPLEEISVRIKLPGSDRIFAVARLSDGRVIGAQASVRITVGGCGASGSASGYAAPSTSYYAADAGNDKYAELPANGVIRTGDNSVSTFSIDVDTASYSNVRRFLMQGQLPPSAAVRTEELINYFPYEFSHRDANLPFGVNTEIAPTPWNAKTHLLRIALAARDLPRAQLPPANLVFLIDVSGSMAPPNKLPLLKAALRMLVLQLREQDRIAIAVYAGAAGMVLAPTSGHDKASILAALERLDAGGSTNGGEGIRLAYALARQGYISGGINRVLVATDGDFNVGVVSQSALLDLVKRERESGIALTTLGFGMGNYNDKLLEQLADQGNGNHAYIDNLREARKALGVQLAGTLYTVAHDVKIQVLFNPATVAEYRLIGYENRALKREDFANDKVDAGDMGAGHRVTAPYEVALVGRGGERIEPSPYEARPTLDAKSRDELARVRLRYKPTQAAASRPLEYTVHARDVLPAATPPSPDWRFAAAVAAFGQALRGEPYTERFGFEAIAALGEGVLAHDPGGHRREFVELVRIAQSLAQVPVANKR